MSGGRGRLTVAAGGPLLALLAALALHVTPARADFTESLCTDGSPAAPWTEGLGGSSGFPGGAIDECASSTTAGSFAFLIAGTSMAAGSDDAAGVQMPAGEALTNVAVHYFTIPSSGSSSFLRVYYGDYNELLDAEMGNATAGTALSAPLPDATDLVFDVYCSQAGACTFANDNPLSVAALTLTIHDTVLPAVAASGGSLATAGTYSGLETIGYAATDGGSGVAKVTATLGTTVVATALSSCQAAELSPCPHSVSGAFTVDTTALPNGSYPLTLTAYDMSGDPTTVAVDTVRIRNTGTVAVTPRRVHRGHVAARVVAVWDWGHRPYTRMTSLHLDHLPRGASVTLSCRGRGCPRARWSRDHRPRTWSGGCAVRAFGPGTRSRSPSARRIASPSGCGSRSATAARPAGECCDETRRRAARPPPSR